MPDRKGKELNNFNETNVERRGGRTDIFRGSGGTDPKDSNDTKSHSHTITTGGQMVYDRDEAGNEFTNTHDGDAPVDLPDAESRD